MFLFQLSYRYLQIPEKSSAAVSKIRSGKTVSRANFNPTHFKHILQVTPAVWVKTNLNRALQLILTPAPAPGTSPLLPTLLTQKDTYQLKSGFKGHICSRVSLIHPSLTCTTRALLCPIFFWQLMTLPMHRTNNNNIFFSASHLSSHLPQKAAA